MAGFNNAHRAASTNHPAIAMIDSGVGGLSILLAIKKIRPRLAINYLADAKNAPLGEKPHDFIVKRGQELVDWFYNKNIFASPPAVTVVACNTLTVHSIATLRANRSDVNFVGVEPGLKPASNLTHNHRVALLATRATLDSPHIKAKIKDYGSSRPDLAILSVAGVGLVDEIEKNGLESKSLASLLNQYLTEVDKFGADVLVLGCTHYSFLQPMITAALPHVRLIDTATAVAERTVSFLSNPPHPSPNDNNSAKESAAENPLRLFTTGDVGGMKNFIASIPDLSNIAIEEIEKIEL